MSDKRIVLLGAGGHCSSVSDALLAIGEYREAIVLDPAAVGETTGTGLPVVGGDELLPALYEKGFRFAFVTVGSISDASARRRLARLARESGYQLPNIIDPTAVVSVNARLADGIFIGKRAVVNAGCRIGENAIVNSGAVVEHDCAVGAFAHVSPGAVLCGNVTVGDGAHIGANSTIRQGLHIGEHALVGIGSAVTRDIRANAVAYGNPCREIRGK